MAPSAAKRLSEGQAITHNARVRAGRVCVVIYGDPDAFPQRLDFWRILTPERNEPRRPGAWEDSNTRAQWFVGPTRSPCRSADATSSRLDEQLPGPDLRGWLPTSAMARRLGVSPRTVRRRAASGLLDALPNPLGVGAIYRQKRGMQGETPCAAQNGATGAANARQTPMRPLAPTDRIVLVLLPSTSPVIAAELGIARSSVEPMPRAPARGRARAPGRRHPRWRARRAPGDALGAGAAAVSTWTAYRARRGKLPRLDRSDSVEGVVEGTFPLGLASGGGRIAWEPWETDHPHCLVTGTTGSGKTRKLEEWALTARVAWGWRVTIIDFKGGGGFFAALAQGAELVTDPAKAVETLREAGREIAARNTLMMKTPIFTADERGIEREDRARDIRRPARASARRVLAHRRGRARLHRRGRGEGHAGAQGHEDAPGASGDGRLLGHRRARHARPAGPLGRHPRRALAPAARLAVPPRRREVERRLAHPARRGHAGGRGDGARLRDHRARRAPPSASDRHRLRRGRRRPTDHPLSRLAARPLPVSPARVRSGRAAAQRKRRPAGAAPLARRLTRRSVPRRRPRGCILRCPSRPRNPSAQSPP